MIKVIAGMPTGYSSYPDYVASGSDPIRFWLNQSAGLFVATKDFQIDNNVGEVTDPAAINEFDEALLKTLTQGWIRVNGNCIDHYGPISDSSKAALETYHASHPEFKTLTYYDASTGQYINKVRTEQEVVKVAPVVHEVEDDDEETDWPLAIETPFGM